MPKLLAFVACEKVIIEKQFETPTVISIMQRVMFQMQAQAMEAAGLTEIPANAIAPFKWSIFTVWDYEADDVGKTFHQKSDVIMSDGSTGIVKVDLPFIMKDELNFNVANIIGFPVGQLGILTLRVWLESPTGEVLVAPVGYPIKVEKTAAIKVEGQ